MKKIGLEDLMSLEEYEQARDDLRGKVIDVKRRRRVQVGPRVSVLFENRELTVENGGFGAEAAAPAARYMLSEWFGLNKKFVVGTSKTR